MKVRIIGAGFSGLAMAYALTKRGAQVEIYEKMGRVGGLIESQRFDWGLVESGANAIRASESVVQLFKDLDLQYLKMKKVNRKRYIFRDKPMQIPLKPLEMTRMMMGFARRPKPQKAQNLEAYAESVLGYGAANYLVEPAMFGIFADSAKNLSANLIYNYFFKYKSAKSTEASGSLAPVEGMGSLISSLQKYILHKGGEIHLSSAAQISDDIPTVICTDATTAADLLLEKDEDLSGQLRRIEYLNLSSVTLGYQDTQRSIRGFGCLFPATEEFSSLGVLFNNDIFSERGTFLTETWMIQNRDPESLLQKVLADRERLVGQAEAPDKYRIQSWDRALPQYSVELEKVLESLALPEKIYLAGNYLGRMGLAKILDQCHETADRILNHES